MSTLGESLVVNSGSTKVWVTDPSLFNVNMTHYCLVMVDMLGMCYILCMCVCVGASDTTTASDDPYKLELCRCAGRFLGGSQGGAGMPPPGYAQRSAPGGSPGQRPEFFFFFGRFLLFLADFAIFS
jgi:hypothetical protein